ncbi:MAG: chorismate mutase [Erysipelotrichaceae bacterium]|nr:chorismate mutase [Erysipelotrichaceae bacterium]
MEKLNKLRNDLDMCDEVIIDMLRMRFQIVQEIANYKQENGMTIVQPHEEHRKKEKFSKKLEDYKYDKNIMKVFDSMIFQAKRIQSRELFGFNIFLIGFMGVGKSTISQTFKEVFAMDVIEMDQIIAENNGMSISEIFEFHGEPYFRQEETNLLRDCAGKHNKIISCGGGVAMRQENVDEMKKSGKIVLLTAEPKTILGRVKGSHDRPLLENNKTEGYISQLMDARRPAYEAAADVVIHTDGKSTYEICEDIVSSISDLIRAETAAGKAAASV